MYTIVSGDVEVGFKLYGLFWTATDASLKARPGYHVVSMNPPRTNPYPQAYESIDDYMEAVNDDGELAHAVVYGRMETGFRFIGPFYEEDAGKAVRDLPNRPAAIIKIRDASAL
jgi:hypothetical protein